MCEEQIEQMFGPPGVLANAIKTLVTAMTERLPDEIVQHDQLGYTTHSFPVFTGASQYVPRAKDRGDYEKRIVENGREIVTGICAGCGLIVTARQLYAILYSTTGEQGGIFHDMPGTPFQCAPTGPQWYGLAEGQGDE